MVALNLTSPTVAAIDAAVVATTCRDFDLVVRGSSIGHQCERELWYRFRWARQPEQFDGRKLRLFNTGHVEEARMVAWLGMAGVTVQAIDPATGEQWEVTALDRHFKGHLDGKVTGLVEAPVTPHLLECKTHNAKSFAQLRTHGVAASKPEHMGQMQIYMHLAGLTRAFYLAKCKDDDDLYGERVEYDVSHALQLMAKAERIKSAHDPLPKLSDDPDFWLCRNCASRGVCHGGAWALRNCRTCIWSTPIADGAWHCGHQNGLLSVAAQREGCPHHLYLPGLVPGEQFDADVDAETVSYRLADGTTWVDGAGRAVA